MLELRDTPKVPITLRFYEQRQGLFQDGIIFSKAESLSELRQAMQLVESEFTKQNYLNTGTPSDVLIPQHNLLPDSVTFIAKSKDRIIGTLSVVLDSPMGMPMEDLYHDELSALRSQKKSLAQFTQLAIDRDHLRKNVRGETAKSESFVFVQLFKLAAHYCIYKSVDNICMAINPKHERFYTNILLFEPLGELKESVSLENAPALAKSLDLNMAQIRFPEANRITRELAEPPDYAIFCNSPESEAFEIAS